MHFSKREIRCCLPARGRPSGRVVRPDSGAGIRPRRAGGRCVGQMYWPPAGISQSVVSLAFRSIWTFSLCVIAVCSLESAFSTGFQETSLDVFWNTHNPRFSYPLSFPIRFVYSE